MKAQSDLSDEQERLRIEGLRALARIIARHALADQGRGFTPPPGERPDVLLEDESHGALGRLRRNRTA